MNRRSFFKASIAALAGLAIDPEELLWVPSRSRIFVPSNLIRPNISEIVALEMERMLPYVRTLFERDDTFYSILQKKTTIGRTGDIRIPLSFTPGEINEIRERSKS
jgi:hypothetical protein